MAQPELEIVPVCDIRLGELFRANPDLKDQYIGIDTTAIRGILRHFNPDLSGNIQFWTVHDDRLNDTLPHPRIHGTATTLKPKKIHHAKNSVVKIAVGGSSLSFPEDLDSLFKDYILNERYELYSAPEPIAHKRVRNPFKKTTYTYNGSLFDHIAKQMGVTQNLPKIHETVVHELCHAADTPAERIADKKAVRWARWQKQSRYYYGGMATGTVINTLPAVTDIPLYLGLSGYVGALALGLIHANRRKTELENYVRKERPTEKKAYQAEVLANALPRVISFKEQ